MVGKLCRINIKVKFVLSVTIMVFIVKSLIMKSYSYDWLAQTTKGKFCKMDEIT